MNEDYSDVVRTAQEYYDSDDADNFYYHVWGGEDIHIGIYDKPDEDIARASQRTVDAMASQYQTSLDENTHIIDIGAGYGGSARWLVKKYRSPVTCVNLSEAQNARNRAMSAEQNLDDRIVVVDGSFEDIPATREFFDLAWSQDAILHSGQRERVLEEVDRVLKPGGEFIFTDPMQADDCPEDVLQPVLDRIHLESLGSFAFYREEAQRLGWEEIGIYDLTPQLITHYTRVREELTRQRNRLAGKVSDKYMFNMLQGLEHWIDAGEKGYLSWGILHFRKPALNAAA
ncbi:MAG: methyltransferase domain-containing protein [Candidatus Thiodiazotropha sp. (ex Ctena orbiculata)]|uniref:Methyltransferase domain-containing protein n=1 Tax=Candidatus Thiodiazotropha taylori TaxID=2792791 RepID=A0A944M5V7_9GAMM|nr:methyltransferase domain-containing protein [Candidatus Thiodiazotropha taylori]MBV2137637.1 methyltransferase domain-containing protein [Candidatus Thiodiazotropha taylori]